MAIPPWCWSEQDSDIFRQRNGELSRVWILANFIKRCKLTEEQQSVRNKCAQNIRTLPFNEPPHVDVNRPKDYNGNLPNEVAIIMDSKGIDELCRSLERLKIMDSPNHLHLSIFGCSDINLDEHSSGIPNSTLIPQVRIVKVNWTTIRWFSMLKIGSDVTTKQHQEWMKFRIQR